MQGCIFGLWLHLHICSVLALLIHVVLSYLRDSIENYWRIAFDNFFLWLYGVLRLLVLGEDGVETLLCDTGLLPLVLDLRLL